MKIGLSSRLLRKWSNVGSQSLWWLGELGRPGAWWMRNGPRTRKRSEWLRMWTAQGRGALSPTPPLKPAETRPVDQAAGSSSGKLSNRLQGGGGTQEEPSSKRQKPNSAVPATRRRCCCVGWSKSQAGCLAAFLWRLALPGLLPLGREGGGLPARRRSQPSAAVGAKEQRAKAKNKNET